MKKLLILFIGLITFIVGIDNILALDVHQESLQLEDKSSTTIVLNDGVGELGVTPNVEFNVIGDYITYKLVLKNADGKKFKINGVSDDNQNDSIEVSYDYNDELNVENKEIFVTIKYAKLPSNPREELKSVKVFIDLVDEDENEQVIGADLDSDEIATPKTFDNIKQYILLSLISIGILLVIVLYLRRGKKINNTMVCLLIGFVLMPTVAFAIVNKELTFNISFENIKINAEHNVTLYYDNGDSSTIEKVLHNEKMEKPNVPEREGYVFVRWVDESGKEFDFNIQITRDYELKAEWTKKEYTVTFINRSAVYLTVEVEHGDSVERPSSPKDTKSHYFVGWVDADDNEYSFDTSITADTTIYAKYQIRTYSVTFDADGGIPVPDSQIVEYDNCPSKPADPTKEGYTFEYWMSSNGTEINFDTCQISDNVTVKAKWKKNVYTVMFDTRPPRQFPSQNVEHGDSATKPDNPTAPKFYYFDKWVDENNNEYDFSNPITSDTTIYAKYEKIKYTVTFDTDGGTPVPDSQIVEIEGQPTRPADPTKVGHTFVGWIDSVSGDLVDFDNYRWQILSDTILIAKWEKKVYTVTFNSNGGTEIDPKTVKYQEIVEKPADPTKEGYNFVKWVDSNGNEYDFTTPIEDDITLDAEWTRKVYKVSFKKPNIAAPFVVEVEHGNPVARPEDPVAPKFYYFVGWVDADDNEYDFSTPVTSDIMLYAKCEKITYTVTFDTDGGTPVPDSQIVEIEMKPTKPEEPKKDGYIFKYWMYSDDTEFNFDSFQVREDITLTAKWQIEKATISSTDTGSDNTLNLKMKKIANPGVTIETGYNFDDTKVKAFKKATEEQYNAIKDSLSDNMISDDSSAAPVYMWFENSNGIMYWYTEAAKVEFTGTMGRLFAKYTALTDISGLADWDVSGVTDMNRLIQNCNSLSDISPLENWDVSNVTSFQFAFGGGKDGAAPPIADFSPISNWDVGNVTNFNAMFKYNRALTNLNDFATWNMGSALNISNMFTGTANLTNAYAIKKWNVINVTNFGNVFSTGKDSGSPDASSGILAYYNDSTKLPPFDARPGSWTSAGKYNPN